MKPKTTGEMLDKSILVRSQGITPQIISYEGENVFLQWRDQGVTLSIAVAERPNIIWF